VEKLGSDSTVLWNPWIVKSKAMADFGDDEFHQMICVESGNVGKNKLTLAPGKSAIMQVRLSSSEF
jgi:D-hexose-6-phosphate mutarotase